MESFRNVEAEGPWGNLVFVGEGQKEEECVFLRYERALAQIEEEDGTLETCSKQWLCG